MDLWAWRADRFAKPVAGRIRYAMTPLVIIDLMAILAYYQKRYYGAMYSGCGGGYIYVVSDEPVPGGFQVKVRTA